jgi:hypothetical protein
MTISKAPTTLVLFGILFALFLMFISFGNKLLVKLPPRSYYPHDRQYATMEAQAVLGFAALDQWAPVLSGDRQPLHHIALGSPPTPPEALWLTQDQSLTIATGACAAGSISLCAVIVGINDPKIRIWATELCGLPIFWNLNPNAETGDWSNGRSLDLETLEDHPLNVTVTPDWLVLHISDQAPIYWQEATVPPIGCDR